MPYTDKDYKVSNVNYLNKDFSAFKNTLIEYAKTYFPNSYRDFNETSPGMMLIEMSAYVGDVLSFYIDQQYKEMMLPLAEERKNVINMANMLGYKVSPITPSYVDLTFTQTVDANTTDINNIVPNLSQTFAINKGVKISSTSDSSIIFETLDVVDFTTSGSGVSEKNPEQHTFDSNGVVQTYKLTRKVKAISGETKTKTFTVGAPQKFLKLTLPETNVTNIIKVTDSNGNTWYESDFLSQDQVKIETHYDNDDGRTNAYSYFDSDGGQSTVPIPYSLQYIKSSKRFIVEVNENDTTSLVFGNGVLRSGQIEENSFVQLDQVGITIPGEETNIDTFVDPLNFSNNTNTLGESPAHTTLTIEYRTGGGISTNVPSGDLTTINSSTDIVGTSTGKNLAVTNEQPARGGSSGLSIEEIRRGAKAFFATQNRCVTQEDYEARILSMPAKFGNIAKVYAERTDILEQETTSEITLDLSTYTDSLQGEIDSITTEKNNIDTQIANLNLVLENMSAGGEWGDNMGTLTTARDSLIESYTNLNTDVGDLEAINLDLQSVTGDEFASQTQAMGTIDVHILSYNDNKNLVTLPANNQTTHPIKTNLSRYLSQFRMLTDEINIKDGKIINFGVVFEVIAHKSENKSDVKLRCINKIIEYFNINKMQFRQPIYTSDLEYELMGIDGVRSVNFVKLTQGDGAEFTDLWPDGTKLYSFNNSNTDGGLNENIYGWQYDFSKFYGGDDSISNDGIILPSITPSVFELKNPRENVKGVVK